MFYYLPFDAGLLVMAYNKAWALAEPVAFILRLSSLVPAVLRKLWRSRFTRNGLLYATIFYLLFFSSISPHIKETRSRRFRFRHIADQYGHLLGIGLYCCWACMGTVQGLVLRGYGHL